MCQPIAGASTATPSDSHSSLGYQPPAPETWLTAASKGHGDEARLIMGGMSMFDYEPPKEKRPTDYSGTVIGAMLLPVLFFFIYIGKAEMGFTLVLVLGLAMIAIKLRWKLRKHVWFWATIVLVFALHVPLLFIVRWPQSNVPTIAYSLPLGIADFLLIMGAISIAQKVFSKGSSSDEEDE
jgi:hypothetical protein